MTVSEDREKIIGLINEAVEAGAGRAEACEVAGISLRTLQSLPTSSARRKERT